MSSFLVAAAFDLAGENGVGPYWERIAASLTLGKGGDTFQCSIPGGAFAWREGTASKRPARPGQALAVRGASPVEAPDGSFVLFAGRIAERQALLDRFGLAPQDSDGALYGAVHALYGGDCDRLIQGDYAAVQWWPRERRVRLSRSPFSHQPLHVWRDGDRLFVASIPRALQAAGAPSEIDDTHLFDVLLLKAIDGSSTWFRGWSRVATASVVEHTPSGSRSRTFWSIADAPEVRFRRDSDYVEALDEQFSRAVRAALDGAARPGALLSGGFDSQAVAAYAMAERGPAERLRSYTSVPMAGWTPPPNRPRVFGDESPHVRALAEMYPQLEPRYLDAGDRRFGEWMDQVFLLGSWPIHNESNTHWIHEAYRLAGNDGCDVMLSGASGNASFSFDGHTGYSTWLRHGRLVRLVKEVAAAPDHRSFARRLASLAIMPNLPADLRRWIHRNSPYHPSPFDVWCPAREDAAGMPAALERAKADGHTLYFDPLPTSRQWRSAVVNDLSFDMAEIMLSFRLAHGVEERDPTCFTPLMEFCAGIPDDQYLRNGESRWLARRMLRGRVPDLVLDEKRWGSQHMDWPIRFARERDSLVSDIQGLSRDDRLSAIYDFKRLETYLTEWDGADESIHRQRILAAVGRGLSTARFVRFIEGHNA